jgi:SpoVK/Ycf46/Vps4 family AAA+-type ATPase
LAQLTDGYTSSDIAYLVKESARQAFATTLQQNCERLTLISQPLLEVQIRETIPSVTSAELRRYERLRDEFTRKGGEVRCRVGFRTK